jgi:ACR3 family arsenite transporter
VIVHRRGAEWLETSFAPAAGKITPIGLLLTLVIIFSFQGRTILDNSLHIVLIAVPLVIQTLFIFAIAYVWARLWKVEHCVAAPAGLIGASNFFELAVAVAISLFGLSSGATLATVVGVLVEVPVMLWLVRIANRTRRLWPPSLRCEAATEAT